MALEWSKDINFFGLFKRKDSPLKDGYPKKTYINLVIPDEREEVGKRGALTAVIALVALLIFGKFGVYDYFVRVMAKNAELNQLTAELADYKVQLADYEDVLNTYNSYEAARMTNSAADVPLMDALELVDNHVSTVAKVNSLSLKENVLSLTLSDTTLEKISNMVSDLYQQPMVKTVKVTNSQRINSLSQEETESLTMLTLTLQSDATIAANEAASANATTTSGS